MFNGKMIVNTIRQMIQDPLIHYYFTCHNDSPKIVLCAMNMNSLGTKYVSLTDSELDSLNTQHNLYARFKLDLERQFSITNTTQVTAFWPIKDTIKLYMRAFEDIDLMHKFRNWYRAHKNRAYFTTVADRGDSNSPHRQMGDWVRAVLFFSLLELEDANDDPPNPPNPTPVPPILPNPTNRCHARTYVNLIAGMFN